MAHNQSTLTLVRTRRNIGGHQGQYKQVKKDTPLPHKKDTPTKQVLQKTDASGTFDT